MLCVVSPDIGLYESVADSAAAEDHGAVDGERGGGERGGGEQGEEEGEEEPAVTHTLVDLSAEPVLGEVRRPRPTPQKSHSGGYIVPPITLPSTHSQPYAKHCLQKKPK